MHVIAYVQCMLAAYNIKVPSLSNSYCNLNNTTVTSLFSLSSQLPDYYIVPYPFQIVFNRCKLSDFPLKNVVHQLSVDFYCTSLKVHHGHFMGLFLSCLLRYCYSLLSSKWQVGKTLFMQGGPFSTVAGIQRGPAKYNF